LLGYDKEAFRQDREIQGASKMTLDQESISRLSDLIYSGDNYTFILNSVCDCSKAVRGGLAEIEKMFFLGDNNRFFHVTLITNPLMIIYSIKKSLVSRKTLSSFLKQELPEKYDVFSMRDESSLEFVRTEKELLDAVAEENHLKHWGVVGQ